MYYMAYVYNLITITLYRKRNESKYDFGHYFVVTLNKTEKISV